jgi:hypothetical protein
MATTNTAEGNRAFLRALLQLRQPALAAALQTIEDSPCVICRHTERQPESIVSVPEDEEWDEQDEQDWMNEIRKERVQETGH